MSENDSPMQRLIEQADGLFSLPAVAVEVLRLTELPDVDARRLKACIEKDPALTSKLLRVVNSALFGLSAEVSDLNQALALLGIKPLKLLVFGFSLPDALFNNVAREPLAHYWKQTLTKAVAAREISQQIHKGSGDDAFLAGLLQDLGMLVLIQRVGAPYVRFVERARQNAGELLALERVALGFDHIELTVGLLEAWGMPRALVEAMRLPEENLLEEITPAVREVRQMVALAHLLTQIVVDRRTDLLGDLILAGEPFSLAEPRLQALAIELEEKVLGLADVLKVDLPQGLGYREVMDEAHARLVRASTEAAVDLVRADRHAEILQDDCTHDLTFAVSRLLEQDDRGPDAAVESVSSVAAGEHHHARRDATVQGAAVIEPSTARAIGEDDSLLVNRVALTVTACRRARCGVSLLLVELDHFGELAFRFGPQRAERLHRLLEAMCGDIDHANVWCAEVREACFAVLLPGCERGEAVRLGNDLLRSVREIGRPAKPVRSTVAVSVGIATLTMPSKNFPAGDLIDAASRCLYGAQASGGDTLKSIEIY